MGQLIHLPGQEREGTFFRVESEFTFRFVKTEVPLGRLDRSYQQLESALCHKCLITRWHSRLLSPLPEDASE